MAARASHYIAWGTTALSSWTDNLISIVVADRLRHPSTTKTLEKPRDLRPFLDPAENGMDVPRSRRQAPLTAGSFGNAPHRPSPTKAPLQVQQAFSDQHSEMMSLDGVGNLDKKSGRAIQLTWVLLLAMTGTFLFTMLLSLKAHLNHSVLDQFSSNMSTLYSTRSTGHMKNQTLERLQQQLDFQVTSKSGMEGTDCNTTITRGGQKTNYKDKFMKGLLTDFSKFESPENCASRGHRSTKYTPTPYLIQRLRGYEVLHRKCAPHAEDFMNHILQGESSRSEAERGECRFVVWIAYSGLGNRMLSLVSAFLYALLTNRILLVDRSTDMSELFCEPFAGTSWLLDVEFPHAWLASLNESSDHRFGTQFKTNVSSPTFSYVHLTHTYDLDDKMFFCDQAQDYLYPVPWLLMRANNYIVPGLYFLPSFRTQLDKLFSNKETVFHLLGRYLFHPSNAVWGWINRFRRGYLANNGKQVGIQIRTFNDTHQAYFQEQLSRCALENEVLPDTITMHPERSRKSFDMERSGKVTSILVTSLQPEYYWKIREFYMSAPTTDGQVVAVHQPSHEGWQKTGTFSHDLKAWADIYLLSFSDGLITSGWSTFGYVSQALAGVKPWILFRSFNYTVPNPPCTYARSLEPCFHRPPLMDCKNTGVPRNPAKLLPFVQNCEDIPWGIKLVEPVAAN